jgi:hypothetical protein
MPFEYIDNTASGGFEYLDDEDQKSAEFAARREAIEPGIMGETRPLEQKLLENATSALSGATLPPAAAGLVKGAAGLGGKAVQSVPGMKNFGEYLNRFAQNQMIKNIGGVRGQINQLGPEKARAIADYAFEKGLAGPLTGSVGMEQNIANQAKLVGGKLGSLRESVKTPQNVPELTTAIQAKLDPEILIGARAGERGAYKKALNELAKLGESASPSDIAKKVTYLNQEAKNLASLKAPSGAMADVAREARAINDAKIKAALGPKAGEYEGLLSEYQKIKPIEAMERRGTVQEMAGRGGPGLLHGGVNKLMDIVGHKTLAAGAKNIANQIRAPWQSNLASAQQGLTNVAAQDQNEELKRYLMNLYGGQ